MVEQATEITITIDGVPVKTQPGKMVLEAAIEAGLYVPYLCYHPGMKPFAACRMCVVEVEGGRGYPASCTLPVQDGMVVKSDTHQVYQLRRSITEMLISEHPHGCLTCHRVDLCGPQDVCLRHVSVNDRCVTCPKNERCELKDTTRALNMDLESPLSYKYRDLPVETGDPFYDRDYNLCIVCGRCVRVCEEVRGDNAITFTERAGQALVGTSHGTSLLESGCEFCGACLDVCPVGALVESDHKWEKASRVEKTICPHCPVGCQLNLEVNRFDKVIRSIPELNSPANHGQACFKGKFGLEFVNRKDRLKAPLIRRGSTLEEASWEEALDLIAQTLPKYKGSRFAILTSPNSTNEEHYLAQKFARAVMVTNNVDQTSNITPELVMGLKETLGHAAATNPTWDLEKANCILAFNTNVTEEHNVLGVPIKRAVKEGTKLIVVDPREVELTRYAEIWLKPRPGTELLLLGGLLKCVLEDGLDNKEWLTEHSVETSGLSQALAALDLNKVSAQTGVEVDQIREAAKTYAGAATGAIVYALDNVAQSIQGDCVHSLADLAILTGNLGKPSTGIYPLRQGTNEQGAWDMGCVPHLLPGYRETSSAEDRQEIEQNWDRVIPIETGLDLRGIFGSITQGEVKAMIIVGDSANFTNSSLSGWPENDEWDGDALKALEDLDFLVVQDHFLSPIAQKAHVVLPRSTFAEKEGTYTSLERRIQGLHPVIKVKNSQAQPEWWAICEIAKRMNGSGFEFANLAEVMDEIARVVPMYGGVSHRRLEAEARLVARPDPSNPLPIQLLYSDKEHRGLQWPCPDESHNGTPVLYADGFSEGNPKLAIPDFRGADITLPENYSFLYVPGRVLLQSDREFEVVPGQLNQIERHELVELSPEDAQSLNIDEGALLEVTTPQQRFQGKAAINAEVHRGTVSVTRLFGQMAIELEASEEPDPMSKVPVLTIRPAKVIKVSPDG